MVETKEKTKTKTLDTSWKIYFKHDGCSMLLFKNMTQSGAIARVRMLKGISGQWCGNFIITK